MAFKIKYIFRRFERYKKKYFEYPNELREGRRSLRKARLYLDCDIAKDVDAIGKAIFVNDFQEGRIIIESKAVLNSNYHGCMAQYLYSPVFIRTICKGSEVIIRRGVNLNGTNIVARSCKIEIDEGTNVGPNCSIMDSDFHDTWPSEGRFERPAFEKDQDIFIGKNVWISANCTILKGVRIGDNSIIAAGSVVRSNIPAGCLAGGVPARVIRQVE